MRKKAEEFRLKCKECGKQMKFYRPVYTSTKKLPAGETDTWLSALQFWFQPFRFCGNGTASGNCVDCNMYKLSPNL